MHYVSLEYFLWMGGTFSCYWAIQPEWRQTALVLITTCFLLVYAPISFAILTVFALFTTLVARQEVVSGRLAAISVLLIIAVLSYYKLGASGLSVEAIVQHALIPLGLSYYSFRCIHVILERYRGRFRGATAAEIIGYLFFLPTILVGPIHRFGAYQRDRYRVTLDTPMLTRGLERILYGYVKIGFIANYLIAGKLGAYVDQLPAEQASLQAYLWIAQGGLNLYFQFSGFADIAIGFSRLLGFRVIENFNWPYLQKNLSEYWRCWHISLTSWCRDYIYTTVVSYSRSPALGAVTTLLAIGLWHEISIRFILWGLYHGCGLVVWQWFQHIKPMFPTVRSAVFKHGITFLSIALTVHYVWFGFAIVRKENLSEVLHVWQLATIGFLR